MTCNQGLTPVGLKYWPVAVFMQVIFPFAMMAMGNMKEGLLYLGLGTPLALALLIELADPEIWKRWKRWFQ